MMQNSPPSIDFANLDSLAGTFRAVFKKLVQGLDGGLPAMVTAYNRTTNIVTVQPMISVLTTSGAIVPRAPIAGIPVYQIGGGGFILSFPLMPGDLGWLIVNDRDISLFNQNFQQSKPNTLRMKDFADSTFYPHKMFGYTIADEDASNAVLQSADGSVKISFGAAGIKILAPTVTIESTAAVINTTTAEITASTSVSVASPIVEITSSTSVSVASPIVEITSSTSVSVASPIVEITSSTSVSVASPIVTLTVPVTCQVTTPNFHVTGNITASGTITPLTPP